MAIPFNDPRQWDINRRDFEDEMRRDRQRMEEQRFYLEKEAAMMRPHTHSMLAHGMSVYDPPHFHPVTKGDYDLPHPTAQFISPGPQPTTKKVLLLCPSPLNP